MAQNGPIVLGAGPHLFIDRLLIAERAGLKRTIHGPDRLEQPVIVGQPRPDWHHWIFYPDTVLFDEERGVFRLWYGSRDPFCVCYAESADGIHFERPALGLVANYSNAVMEIPGFAGAIVDDGPDCADPSRRFKMPWFGRSGEGDREGMNIAFSPDGFHWEQYEGNPVLPYYRDRNGPSFIKGVGDIVGLYRDPIRGHYIAMVKMFGHSIDNWTQARLAGAELRRLVGMAASEDCIHWSQPVRVVVPDDQDEGQIEFYGVGDVFARGDLLVGLLRVLRDDLPADEGGPVEGIGYTCLVTSRDGQRWRRDRETFFDRNHERGTFDHAMAWAGDSIEVGDERFIYYTAYSAGHKIGERQIGLAKMPRDRFVSLDNEGDGEGIIRTSLLTLRRSAMTLNADASRGEIRIQITDATGKAVPGFDFEDCRPVRSDSLSAPVSWGAPLASLDGRPVKMAFSLRKASLFGFSLT